jgi:hypothetical protein
MAIVTLFLFRSVLISLYPIDEAESKMRRKKKDRHGWVTERSIVHAWKACVPKGTGGSNPPPSAVDLLALLLLLRVNANLPVVRRLAVPAAA